MPIHRDRQERLQHEPLNASLNIEVTLNAQTPHRIVCIRNAHPKKKKIPPLQTSIIFALLLRKTQNNIHSPMAVTSKFDVQGAIVTIVIRIIPLKTRKVRYKLALSHTSSDL